MGSFFLVILAVQIPKGIGNLYSYKWLIVVGLILVGMAAWAGTNALTEQQCLAGSYSACNDMTPYDDYP